MGQHVGVFVCLDVVNLDTRLGRSFSKGAANRVGKARFENLHESPNVGTYGAWVWPECLKLEAVLELVRSSFGAHAR